MTVRLIQYKSIAIFEHIHFTR